MKNKAFTLVELLIYVGLISLLVGFLTPILIITAKIQNQQVASYEVGSQMNVVMNYAQNLTRESSHIEIEPGKELSYLVLRTQNGQKDPTILAINNGLLEIKEGAAATTTPTTAAVKIDSLSFKRIASASGHDSLEIRLTMSYNTPNPNFLLSKVISSAVARVSAATFDSSVLPGVNDSYDLGLSANQWRNAFISGRLEVAGGLRLNTSAPLPTCDEARRGTLWFSQEGVGIADKLLVCSKNATDSYEWVSL